MTEVLVGTRKMTMYTSLRYVTPTRTRDDACHIALLQAASCSAILHTCALPRILHRNVLRCKCTIEESIGLPQKNSFESTSNRFEAEEVQYLERYYRLILD